MNKQELISITLRAAAVSYNDGFKQQSWHLLFKWAALNYRSNTPRQAEQRKLAMQLRQLTGCIGNLKNLLMGFNYAAHESYAIKSAIKELDYVEHKIRLDMKTIKGRIPA